MVCNEQQATEIERLADEYDLSEEAVLRQLVGLGLKAVD